MLNAQISRGILAKVVYSDIQDVQDRVDAIEANANIT
jgi:hypothetical protein